MPTEIIRTQVFGLLSFSFFPRGKNLTFFIMTSAYVNVSIFVWASSVFTVNTLGYRSSITPSTRINLFLPRLIRSFRSIPFRFFTRSTATDILFVASLIRKVLPFFDKISPPRFAFAMRVGHNIFYFVLFRIKRRLPRLLRLLRRLRLPRRRNRRRGYRRLRRNRTWFRRRRSYLRLRGRRLSSSRRVQARTA